MIYTVKINLDSDGYTPENETEVIDFIKRVFDKTAVFVSDIEILDIND